MRVGLKIGPAGAPTCCSSLGLKLCLDAIHKEGRDMGCRGGESWGYHRGGRGVVGKPISEALLYVGVDSFLTFMWTAIAWRTTGSLPWNACSRRFPLSDRMLHTIIASRGMRAPNALGAVCLFVMYLLLMGNFALRRIASAAEAHHV